MKFDAVYPGIDLVYYGSQGQLESDYIVSPGADPKRIAFRVEGADRIRLNSGGDAILSTTAGDVSLRQPRAYQENSAGRVEVAANYISLANGALGIRVGDFNAKLPLVIDPVVGYSTLLSGSNSSTAGTAIAVDSSGNAYIVGATGASDFPTTAGAFQKTQNGPTGNAFVTKLNSTGTALVFSTYLGGSGQTGKFDNAAGVAVDAGGDVYITGSTPSTDFPIKTQNAYQVVNNGTPGNCFLTKLDPTGSTLLYSTYLGGSGNDGCTAIALDSNGNAYVTGTATSTIFPVTPGTAIQTAGQSTGLAFVSRFDTTLSGTKSLVYSTLLGGTSANQGTGIAVDASFSAYITGQTNSTDFPVTAGAFQSTLKGTAGNAFVSRVDTTTANNLVYSTYLGGATATGSGDVGTAIAIGPSSNVFVTGITTSSDFPVTAGVLQTTPKNATKTAFVARLDTTKSNAQSLRVFDISRRLIPGCRGGDRRRCRRKRVCWRRHAIGGFSDDSGRAAVHARNAGKCPRLRLGAELDRNGAVIFDVFRRKRRQHCEWNWPGCRDLTEHLHWWRDGVAGFPGNRRRVSDNVQDRRGLRRQTFSRGGDRSDSKPVNGELRKAGCRRGKPGR